jgi:CRISPR system Cascade subunit CasC
MFVELHMIQNFAPSNLNRDDTNNPKDCEFGGHRRARISSQCLKRAIRRSPVFAQTTGVDISWRTKWLTRLLRPRLVEAGKPEEQVGLVVKAFVDHYIGDMDKEGRTAILVYLSNEEARAIAAELLENWDAILADIQPPEGKKAAKSAVFEQLSKELVKKGKRGTSAPDIALFGRMLTAQPELGMEAACQVAHAISTNRVTMEMDFFTAVDDLQTGEEPGAGMMGFTGFDSACFYRYARLDWKQLLKNLRGDVDLARRTVEGFLRAAVAAVPTGKQNSMAAHNPPSFILAVVREDGMGWSLVNAFEKPVRPSPRGDSGLVSPSVEALDEYWGHLCDVYGDNTLRAVLALPLDPDQTLKRLAGYRQKDLDNLVNGVLAILPVKEAEA